VRLLMEELDGHMVEIPEPQRALRDGEDQSTLAEEAARYGLRDFGRRAFGWE
jgi:hypothetical protein